MFKEEHLKMYKNIKRCCIVVQYTHFRVLDFTNIIKGKENIITYGNLTLEFKITICVSFHKVCAVIFYFRDI